MVIFLNKIIFLPQVKDSLLPINLCQENRSQSRPVLAAKMARFILETMKRLGEAGGKPSSGSPPEELALQQADLHDNHHYGSSLVPASTLNRVPYNFSSSRGAQVRAGAHILQDPNDVKNC